MGYTTDFDGHFDLDRPLSDAQTSYLTKFANTRRMKRITDELHDIPDPVREAVGLPLGPEGAYFVGGLGYNGQERDKSVLEYNDPPSGQPGLWCQWEPACDDDGNYNMIAWDGGEKFYDYVEWLEYIINNFLAPWGYKLNGEVKWHGESNDDFGKIIVNDNVVTVKVGKIVYDYE